MRHLDDVVVVCSCQTLIRSDHDISTPLFFLRDLLLLVKIAVLHLRNVAQESGNGTLKCIEIRFRLLKLLLALRSLAEDIIYMALVIFMVSRILFIRF